MSFFCSDIDVGTKIFFVTFVGHVPRQNILKSIKVYLRFPDAVGDEVPNLIVDAVGFLATRRVGGGEEVLFERRILLRQMNLALFETSLLLVIFA